MEQKYKYTVPWCFFKEDNRQDSGQWAVMVIMSYFGVKTDYAQHDFSLYVACS